MPFWIYSDYVRDPFRTLMTTVERHAAVHQRTAERDVILLVMVNDSREAHPHQRWAARHPTCEFVPRVATTSYRKLRAWPTDAIWWPVDPRTDTATGGTVQARRLYQLGRQTAAIRPAAAHTIGGAA